MDGGIGIRGPKPPCLLPVYAVLLGVLLMHGSPAVVGGCHGAVPKSASASPRHAAASMSESGAAAYPVHASGLVHTEAGTEAGMGGVVCVSTAPRNTTQLPAPGLLAIGAWAAATAALLWRRTGWTGNRRRGPPPSGRELLLRVCIART